MADNAFNDSGRVEFISAKKAKSIIKVIGVGGGGGNAVNHMYREGIHDVTFLVCNTDRQALEDSPIPDRLQLGDEGLGAGTNPIKGRTEAENSIEQIRAKLSDGTKMVFITAGMGGGTGTGAGPIVAKVSKEMDILTVGIVTIPFIFEGAKKIDQALDGVEEMAKNVDALLVINNERLREIYPSLGVLDAFGKADDTLSIAARSIAEIITEHGIINVDFQDVKNVLKEGGVAIMSTGYGEGEGRLRKAIEDALNSPLLNDNDIYNSKKILLSIKISDDKDEKTKFTMEEMNEVHEFMGKITGDYESKFGLSVDPELGEKVKVTILATGFGMKDIDVVENHMNKKEAQEEAINNAKKQQEVAQKMMLRGKYYGGDVAHRNAKRNFNVFLFDSEDLSNEEIILEVEKIPTYKRSIKALEDIRRKLKKEPTNDNNDGQEPIQGLITFA
ncbi:cell division protein FtsZ [Hoylesella nanceiensis]|jgi:cell division protein ftsZ|uniref:cell division protein FtsZ n=1 Tax=Hoylesella nanceiensis TaxID=425941 RepID=UPI001CB18539|nr:cell division protein FtsZ [Hoylesella nanceiensis]MBF1426310.1 cell division protein FtsZ [Hoylesella nanceiensis]MBF1432485.1 cell division protein FtsZ [Hoylesella nanceiensis]MBF1434486.1 cell division protein FtsZ [Hoylesella nanceiensis]MBF1436861.1 cell division protein FtsZ [Hoylesella nanceiensis]MBF1440246.1 cell division protein FtsZ [Hoylesella nanceiensis]